jgi:Holliday junction resolvase-like predicted endonuclease
MAKTDAIEPQVVNALIHDGWTIVQTQIAVRYETWTAHIDLLVRSSITAVQGEKNVVIEVKSFQPRLKLADLEKAVGQYLIYKSWLARKRPGWDLYLAISTRTAKFFADEAIQVVVKDYGINLLIVDIKTERIVAWQSTAI